MVSTIDILPTELGSFGPDSARSQADDAAKDASEHFSKCLMPYMKQLAAGSPKDSVIKDTLERATIVRAGALSAPHEWLQSRIEEHRSSEIGSSSKATAGKRKVLLLGSGLVAGPAVEVFAARPDVHLIIGASHCWVRT